MTSDYKIVLHVYQNHTRHILLLHWYNMHVNWPVQLQPATTHQLASFQLLL